MDDDWVEPLPSPGVGSVCVLDNRRPRKRVVKESMGFLTFPEKSARVKSCTTSRQTRSKPKPVRKPQRRK